MGILKRKYSVGVALSWRSLGCVIFCMLVCASASCGIFSPRPVEYPTTTIVDDPFNFASILYNTGKTFTKLDYNDLFAGDPDGMNIVYYDLDGRQFTKKDLIANLTLTQNTMTVKTSTWKSDPETPDLTISDTMIIVNRLYTVAAEDSLNKVFTFANKASFTVVKNSTTNAWTIQEWRDQYPGYSIFHPWFSPN
jgi:hypothetical protein